MHAVRMRALHRGGAMSRQAHGDGGPDPGGGNAGRPRPVKHEQVKWKKVIERIK